MDKIIEILCNASPFIQRQIERLRTLESNVEELKRNSDRIQHIELKVSSLEGEVKKSSSPPSLPARTPAPSMQCLGSIAELAKYARNYKRVYLFGADKKTQMYLKFFDDAEISIAGLLEIDEKNIPSLCPESKIRITVPRFFYRKVSMNLIQKVKFHSDSAVIIPLPENKAYVPAKCLKNAGCEHFACLSDTVINKQLSRTMPRSPDGTGLQINIVKHCNLNCYACNHFSQLSEPWFMELSDFEKDIKRCSELTNGVMGNIFIMGGEPLLHEKCADFCILARNYFPEASIGIFTNGILLNKQNNDFWEILRENRIKIDTTIYPVNFDYQKAWKEGEARGVPIYYHMGGLEYNKSSRIYPMNLTGDTDKDAYIDCDIFTCFTLDRGRIFHCPIISEIDIFNRYFGCQIEERPGDFIDIFQVSSFFEIAEFLTRRSPMCSHCNNRNVKNIGSWRQSKKTADEYGLQLYCTR